MKRPLTLDLATAKLATAKVCNCVEVVHLYQTGIGDVRTMTFAPACPKCTNGVQFSDDRARELLSRLALLEHENKTFSDNLTAVVAERDEMKKKVDNRWRIFTGHERATIQSAIRALISCYDRPDCVGFDLSLPKRLLKESVESAQTNLLERQKGEQR